MKSFTAGKNEDGVRLSRFVQNVTANMPASLLYKSFRNKRIKVNGKKGAPDTRLAEGDLIELYINDEFFPAGKPAPAKPKSRKKLPPLCVVYEDDNIAALYKPAHLLCHSDRTGDASLVEMFAQHLAEKGEFDAAAETTFSPALCNRIDRGTEGLVLAAKNYAALRDMNAIIRGDLLCKEYYCITAGIPPKGRHIAYLKHFEKNNKVLVRKDPAPEYKQIITDVAICKTKGPFALCRIGISGNCAHLRRGVDQHAGFIAVDLLQFLSICCFFFKGKIQFLPPDHSVTACRTA